MEQSNLFVASIWKEGEWFIAQCLSVDVASQGESEEEALNHLREALKLHFEDPVATVTGTVDTTSIPMDRVVEVLLAA